MALFHRMLVLETLKISGGALSPTLRGSGIKMMRSVGNAGWSILGRRVETIVAMLLCSSVYERQNLIRHESTVMWNNLVDEDVPNGKVIVEQSNLNWQGDVYAKNFRGKIIRVLPGLPDPEITPFSEMLVWTTANYHHTVLYYFIWTESSKVRR